MAVVTAAVAAAADGVADQAWHQSVDGCLRDLHATARALTLRLRCHLLLGLLLLLLLLLLDKRQGRLRMDADVRTGAGLRARNAPNRLVVLVLLSQTSILAAQLKNARQLVLQLVRKELDVVSQTEAAVIGRTEIAAVVAVAISVRVAVPAQAGPGVERRAAPALDHLSVRLLPHLGGPPLRPRLLGSQNGIEVKRFTHLEREGKIFENANCRYREIIEK